MYLFYFRSSNYGVEYFKQFTVVMNALDNIGMQILPLPPYN